MSEATGENTQPKRKGEHLAAYQFKEGNPGRPKGSRNKLGEDFVHALAKDFEANGDAAIKEVRETKPDAYLKVIAQVIPKEIHHRVEEFDELSDDELSARFLAAAASLGRGREAGRGIAATTGAKGSKASLPN